MQGPLGGSEVEFSSPRLVEDATGETVHLVRQAIHEGRHVYMLVNNRVEGNAPLTVQPLSESL